jgi:hypothetical protein
MWARANGIIYRPAVMFDRPWTSVDHRQCGDEDAHIGHAPHEPFRSNADRMLEFMVCAPLAPFEARQQKAHSSALGQPRRGKQFVTGLTPELAGFLAATIGAHRFRLAGRA